jgi:VWFA-related protein
MLQSRIGPALRAFRRRAFIAALLSAVPLGAQQAPPPESSAPVIRSTTHLVLVDVVVYDKQGNHVTTLTSSDFTLRDRGKPQKIAIFSDDHAGESPAENAFPPAPPLPPRVFTNRPEYHRSAGPPTILLLDGLNTASGDQISSHAYLLQYLRTQLKESQGIAILSLTESLGLLQDFTTDPQLLIAALDKSRPAASNELAGAPINQLTPVEAAILPKRVLQNIDRFNQSRAAESTDIRVRITLGALRSIARAVDGIPGRKNLVWVSAGFPFSLHPGTGEYPDAQRDYGEDIRGTAALLASARVALYTVDARGLGVGDVGEPMNPSAPLVDTVQQPSNPLTAGDELANAREAVLNSHQTMQSLAEETGGLALYNHNDIAKAVALSAADGDRYYTLGYYPEGNAQDGKFHHIEVKLNRGGLTARYRSGYFAVAATQISASDSAQQRDRRAYEELRTALADPLPATQVTFRVHIPPPESAARPQLQIQFLVDAPTISFEPLENGLRHCSLDFMAAAVSPEGKLIASDGHSVDARLQPEQFTQANQNGLPFSMQLPLPPGIYSLHLAVRDNRTGLIGTLTVPLSVQAP